MVEKTGVLVVAEERALICLSHCAQLEAEVALEFLCRWVDYQLWCLLLSHQYVPEGC